MNVDIGILLDYNEIMKSRNKTLEKLSNKLLIEIQKLPEREGEILLEFIRFLKKRREEQKKILKKKINFRAWNLNSEKRLTRKEIYDYL